MEETTLEINMLTGTSRSQDRPQDRPVVIICKDSNWPSGIPDLFSGTNSGNMVSLTINGAKAEDEAITIRCGTAVVMLTVTQADVRVRHKPLPHLYIALFQPLEACGQSNEQSVLGP